MIRPVRPTFATSCYYEQDVHSLDYDFRNHSGLADRNQQLTVTSYDDLKLPLQQTANHSCSLMLQQLATTYTQQNWTVENEQ